MIKIFSVTKYKIKLIKNIETDGEIAKILYLKNYNIIVSSHNEKKIYLGKIEINNSKKLENNDSENENSENNESENDNSEDNELENNELKDNGSENFDGNKLKKFDGNKLEDKNIENFNENYLENLDDQELIITSIRLFYGMGIRKNEMLSKKCCLISSDKGNLIAEGWKYFNGWGVDKNFLKSIEYFQFSLENGNCHKYMSLYLKMLQ